MLGRLNHLSACAAVLLTSAAHPAAGGGGATVPTEDTGARKGHAGPDTVDPAQGMDDKQTSAQLHRHQAQRNLAEPGLSPEPDAAAQAGEEPGNALAPGEKARAQRQGKAGVAEGETKGEGTESVVETRTPVGGFERAQPARIAGPGQGKAAAGGSGHEARRSAVQASAKRYGRGTIDRLHESLPPGSTLTVTATGVEIRAQMAGGGATRVFAGKDVGEALAAMEDELTHGPALLQDIGQDAGQAERQTEQAVEADTRKAGATPAAAKQAAKSATKSSSATKSAAKKSGAKKSSAKKAKAKK